MNSKDQAAAYLQEAELTLLVAQSIFDSAIPDDPLWAQIVKNIYDAIEQAVSAAIADKGSAFPVDIQRRLTNSLNYTIRVKNLRTDFSTGFDGEATPSM